MKYRSIAYAAALLVGCASLPTARAVDLFVAGNVTDNLVPPGNHFFMDDASIGGGDADINQNSASPIGFYARNLDLFNFGAVGAVGVPGTLTLTGFGFATSAAVLPNDATTVELTFVYLGADEVGGGGDDITIGSTVVDYAYPAVGAASEYYVNFESPLSAAIDGLGDRLQIRVAPMNATGTGSIRFKTATTLPFETDTTTQKPKFSLAGNYTYEGDPPPMPLPPPNSNPVHRFVASQDDPADAVWVPVPNSAERFAFGSDQSPIAVSDAAVPGITAAYSVPSDGEANVFEKNIAGNQASRQDATFELWFRPDSLAGGEQVLYEFGGAGSGGYLSLAGSQLSFYVNGVFIDPPALTTTLSAAEWTQVVGVIHNTYQADPMIPSQDDYLELYINGVKVGDTQSTLADINDWAGGNDSGLGQDGQTIAAGGPIATDTAATGEFLFAGQIAILDYTNSALSATQVMDRYLAITTASAGLAGDYNGDGTVDAADYTVYRDNVGGDAALAFATGTRGAGNTGPIAAGDYDTWRANFGATSGGLSGSGTPVPEPSAFMLLGAVCALAAAFYCRS